MRGAAPLSVPIGNITVVIDGKTVTVPVMITNTAWITWFHASLDLYQGTDKYLDPQFRDYGKYEPPDPRIGLEAYADGINWNPGNGAGNYVYYGPNDWRSVSYINQLEQQIADLEQRLAMASE
jgi:hypothetical protein